VRVATPAAPPAVGATSPVRRRRDHTLTATERPFALALAVGAAAMATLSGAHPTGLGVTDAVLLAVLGAGVTLAATRARRWSLVWMAAVATAGAAGSGWVLVGAFALALCAVSIAMWRRSPVLNAAVAALAVQAALRVPDIGVFGLPSVIAAVAVLPLLWSAYTQLPSSARRRAARATLAFIALIVLVIVGFGFAAFRSRAEVEGAVDHAREALVALRAGDQARAGQLFDSARADFDDAHESVNAPWAFPARAVPVLAQHSRALSTATAAGAAVAAAGAQAATAAPYRELRASQGTIDLARLASMQAPIDRSVEALHGARREVDAIDPAWLLPQITTQLDAFDREIDAALPDAELAGQALHVLPGMLGRERVQRYFIAIGTPAESRFQGGFMGAYAELTADHGQVRLSRSGSIDDLNHAPGADHRTLAEDPAYLASYGRFNPVKWMQNDMAAPDLPTNAKAIAELYPQSGGAPIDGVIYVDPVGLAALLQLTGPVAVDGVAQPLTATDAAAYLLRGQYLDDRSRAARQDALIATSTAAFNALTGRDLPTPQAIIDALGPAVRGGHLALTTFDPDAGAFLDRIGASGRFADAPGGDHLDVRVSNAGGNKIDTFLSRSIDYAVDVDPATGTYAAVATIHLRNDAPAIWLPDYVIGNLFFEPPGTSRMYAAVYTPGTLVSASRDGMPLALGSQEELGGHAYGALLSIPSGTTTTIELHLTGQVDPADGYRLAVGHQPLTVDDQLHVSVRSTAPGRPVVRADGLDVGDGRADRTGPLPEPLRTVVRFGPPG